MQQLSNQGIVKGLPTMKFSNGVCEGCALGKHPEEKFPKGISWRASSPLELVYSDLMDLFLEHSMRKSKYVITFTIDVYSRYILS